MTTQAEVRRAFWDSHPDLSRKRISYGDHKTYTTDTRSAFVDFVDSLARDGTISERLASKVTL